MLALSLLGCAPQDPRSDSGSASAGDGTSEGSSDAGSVGKPEGPGAGDSTDGDRPGGPDDGAQFDVGEGKDEAGGDPTTDGGALVCGTRSCEDTTANAAVLLAPCDEFFADFHPPYDEHYQCWSGAPAGYLIGDTDAVFAFDNPDMLLIGRFDGGIAQAEVTRDANCNITGFVDAQWQPYPDGEPSEVFVRGMTWLDDGTMLLARTDLDGTPQQIGQRAPDSGVTANLIDAVSLLPPWEQLYFGGANVIVAISVVPPGFPGAGSTKLIAEKLDSSHWFTLPTVADGNGGYTLGNAIEATTIQPPQPQWGGYYARGIAWIGTDNPDIDKPSVLVPEAWDYVVALYELDDDGNPVPQSRTVFVEGIGMPSGAESDAVSGNNFVFTGRRSQDVYVVRGCDDAPGSDIPRG